LEIQNKKGKKKGKQKRLQLKATTVCFVIFLQDSEGRRNATVKAKIASVFRHDLNAQMGYQRKAGQPASQ
jgi:hypothetical protein